jgi:FtsZ-interacting cell division protein ZipA
MIYDRFFFAQTTLPLDNVSVHGMTTLLREVMIVTGAVAAVTLLLVLWVLYFRKHRLHHTHHHSHHHHSSEESAGAPPPVSDATATDPEDFPETHRHRRRRRRRRREHRPRNPTLAETGGLPPLRSDRPPEPLP